MGSMYKTNYNEIMLNMLATNKCNKILLHCCCAPCACYPLSVLKEYGEITLYYCNPNITDKDEYDLRLNELQRLGEAYGAEVIDYGFDGESFFKRIATRKDEKEGGASCAECIDMRLSITAEYCKDNGYDFFMTTLTVSPLKNAERINIIGSQYDKYLPSDFKKNDGYKKGTLISNQYGFYRQNYCGCVYSRLEAEARSVTRSSK